MLAVLLVGRQVGMHRGQPLFGKPICKGHHPVRQTYLQSHYRVQDVCLCPSLVYLLNGGVLLMVYVEPSSTLFILRNHFVYNKKNIHCV